MCQNTFTTQFTYIVFLLIIKTTSKLFSDADILHLHARTALLPLHPLPGGSESICVGKRNPNMWESEARMRHNLPHLSLSPVSACALYTGDWVSLVCTASIPFHSCHWFVIFWHLEKFQLGQRKSLFELCIDFEALKSPIYNRKKDTINVVTSILILKWAWALWNMFSNFLLLF